MESKFDELNDVEWLQERVDTRRTPSEIADEVGTTETTVINWVLHHDIEPPSFWQVSTECATDGVTAENLQRMRDDDMSIVEIADELDTSKMVIGMWLVRYDVEDTEEDAVEEETTAPAWTQTGQPWQDADQLRRAYWEYYWSTREIAEWCSADVAPHIIRREMQRKDIPTRGPTEGKKVHRMKERGESLDVVRSTFPEPTGDETEQPDGENRRERSLRTQRDDDVTVEWSKLARGDD